MNLGRPIGLTQLTTALEGGRLGELLAVPGCVRVSGVAWNPRSYVDALARVGPLVPTRSTHLNHPLREVFVVDGGLDVGANWHADLVFCAEAPRFSALLCEAAPQEGGETELVDSRRCLEELPPDLRALVRRVEGVFDGGLVQGRKLRRRGLVEEAERTETEAPLHVPLARVHPESHRWGLRYHAEYLTGFVGLSPRDAARLMEALRAVVDRPDLRYRHAWRPGDLLVFDNRAVLHRRAPGPIAGARRLLRVMMY
ncbi:MAG: TauD/TfdA family dioxygenase [Alphaproteobacteria bacterium]|nr:TauD/TfdA family dioxygenase [Alphaproteobacteria bacterium]